MEIKPLKKKKRARKKKRVKRDILLLFEKDA
jgi:hypothetical protein